MNAACPLLCLLLLALSFFRLLAFSCPSSCANIPNVSFPFGAAPHCGAPGFTLDCSSPIARWNLSLQLPSKPAVYNVRGIQYYGSSGALDLTWAPGEAPSYCNSDKCATNPVSCDLLDGVILSSFTHANLTLSPSTVYLLFGCDENVLREGGTYTDWNFCRSYYSACPGQQTETGCCGYFRPHMPQPDLGYILKHCHGYTSFVTSNFTHEENLSSWDASSIQLSWSEPLNYSQCTNCHGTCGYDNDYKFVCFEDCKGSCTSLKKARAPGLVADLALGVAAAAILVVFCACIVCKRKKICSQSAPGGSGTDFVTGRGKPFAAESGSCATQAFTFEELDQATDSFSDDRLLGDGGFGAVYEGRLYDGRKIAVKRLYRDNSRGMEHFFNEISIILSLAHANLVRLYGYCCEDQRDLLLVFEYVSNGTLADHLHNRSAEALPWKIRLKIALETAEALSYLHNSITPPIFHRDVKCQNILLDLDFHVKLADFGLSRFVPLNASHISTTPQGTPGYLDPDYRHCYQLTNKSDVYSFGVVLVELVSALPAVDLSRNRGEINLSSLATSKIACGAWRELLDPRLDIRREPRLVDMARSVMELAFRCLAEEKEDRPNTKEVAKELGNIWESGYGKLNDRFSINVLSATNESNHALWKHQAEVSPTSVHTPWPSSSTVSCYSSGSNASSGSFA